ncbi:MAG: transposase [Rhodothermales bacterium]
MTAASLGLAISCADQAGPFQTIPYPGRRWCKETKACQIDYEYIRNGTAKLMTLFLPATGEVRVKGTRRCRNVDLHPWMKEQLSALLQTLPVGEVTDEQNRAQWKRWQEGLTRPITLPQKLPRLRMLLVLDNLAGHRSSEFVLWLFAHGIMPLYTPLSGSWLNMAESIQRILKQRALAGTHPKTPEQIIEWLEATARGWNRDPTPFEWGGKRKERRARSQIRRQNVGGSYAYTRRSMRQSKSLLQKWRQLNQMTH